MIRVQEYEVFEENVVYKVLLFCDGGKLSLALIELHQKLVFDTDNRLIQVKSIAECSKGSILQYFRTSLSYHLL